MTLVWGLKRFLIFAIVLMAAVVFIIITFLFSTLKGIRYGR